MSSAIINAIDAIMPAVEKTGLLSTTATFYDRAGGATPIANDQGQVDNTRTPVAGLTDIECIFGVARNSPQFLPTEGARTPTHYTEEPEYHLLLKGYYPAVIARYTVTIAARPGDVFEITPGTVQSDSQFRSQTRCKLRRFSY